jgi:hypothetical protein
MTVEKMVINMFYMDAITMNMGVKIVIQFLRVKWSGCAISSRNS